MKKNNLIDFLIILFIYIGFSCIPFSLFIEEQWLIYLLQIIIQIGILIFIILFVKRKTKLDRKFGKINMKNSLILLPSLLVCFSNYFVIVVDKSQTNFTFIWTSLLLILLTIFVVLNEEIIFRMLLMNNVITDKKWLKIICSALLFGLCHITAFLSSFNPSDLVVIGYTTALGFLLAFSYLYSGSLVVPLIIHFLFNVSNEIIFEMCNVEIKNYNTFIIVNCLIALIAALYILTIYLFNKKLYQKN